MTTPQSPPDTNICVGCGLCCNGTLHGTVVVNDFDEDAVTSLDLEVVEKQGKRSFRQPCPYFACGSCAIYERRPQVCRGYRCALLRAVDDDAMSTAVALDKIAMAKDLVVRVQSYSKRAVTPAQRSRLAARLKSSLSDMEGPERLKAARALLDITALDEFLGRWFRKKNKDEDSNKAGATVQKP